MTTATTTVAEFLVACLHDAGVRTVHGLPGGEVVEILDALRRRGMDFVLTHHESSAVFMADAQARLTGVPGVALTTLGPGATNAAMGVAHAYLDRAPVLLITAQKPDSLLPGYTHQVVDLQAFFAPITKGTFKVNRENAGQVIPQALALLQQGRPGPVHLQVSNEDAGQSLASPPMSTARPTARVAPAGDTLAQARSLLAQARRPLIVAGLGLEPEAPYDPLRELAEALQAPVIATPKAKGCLPDDHPLAGGVIGLTRTDPAYALVDEADCIVAVGFDVVELVKPWEQPAPLIWLAPWPNQDPTLPAAVEYVGPLAPALQQLADGLYQPDSAWGARRVAAFRTVAQEALTPRGKARGERLLPQAVLQRLRAHAARDTLMVVDVGSHKIYSSLAWPTLAPNRFLLSNGLSSMSYALPAAIAGSQALGGAPVLCLTGDAGLAMALGELGVLAQRRLPVIVVVLNDGAIDLIRSHQVRAGKPVFGTEFTSPHFAQIGAAYGLRASRVHHEAELDRALAQAFQEPAPTLIEVMLDPSTYPTTPPALRGAAA